MAEPKVGLVTVTYNSGEVLEGFFKSLWAQEYVHFICIAVDNQSKDETLQQLHREKDERLVIIENTTNLGVAEGNNQGIRYCLQECCDYVLLINNDTEFGPGLISSLLNAAIKYSQPVVIPKMYFYQPSNMIWCAGGTFVRWAAWSNRHIGEGEIDHGQFDEQKAVEYAPTCCMLVKREVFEKIGLMDPDYFVYFDDVDFCVRMNQAGYKIFYLPAAQLWHKVSSLTGGAQSNFAVHYSARNRAMFVNKNFHGSQKVWFHAFCIINIFRRYISGQDAAYIMRRKLEIYSAAMCGKY